MGFLFAATRACKAQQLPINCGANHGTDKCTMTYFDRTRWVVERSFAWAARFGRLARDYEGLSKKDSISVYPPVANV
jgi:transposase